MNKPPFKPWIGFLRENQDCNDTIVSLYAVARLEDDGEMISGNIKLTHAELETNPQDLLYEKCFNILRETGVAGR